MPALGCHPLMQKYHMEGGDDQHGSSTMPWRPINMSPRPPMSGQGMMYGQDWSANASSSHGESEQEHGGGQNGQ
jgi:hypothetical protein